MRVAIFTDNDFDKTNGVTTSLRAVLRPRPCDRAHLARRARALVPELPQLAAGWCAAPGRGRRTACGSRRAVNQEDTDALRVLEAVLRHPMRYFVNGWNWKASITSALSRGLIFFTLNTPAGLEWATRAMVTELLFRTAASGVLGSLSQALRHSRPRLVALLLLPAVGHLAEFLVHRTAGTPRLTSSMVASITFSVLTTAFTMFAMRRGALIVGRGQQPLTSDLRRMPSLVAAFAASAIRSLPVVRRSSRSPAIETSRCSRRHSI
jgi:hypothetical protein